tara:strand:+ start:130 stop:453 length:324 start_codon:yes stop_codon:yes gene_type:complete
MKKKKAVVKAHRGMAHVPLKSKSTGTKRRMIGLPQQFKGATSRRRAPMPQAPAPVVRQRRAIKEPRLITQPKPVVRPPRQSDAGGGGRGVRPVRELPNKGRKILRRT